MKLRKTIVVKWTMECNLRCQYCYEFRQNGDDYVGANIQLDALVALVHRFAVLFPDSEVLWLLHGGEPLLKVAYFFTEFCQAIRDVNEVHGVHFQVALQTNGTLLSKRWLKALEQNSDVFGERMVSVSIDGPGHLNGIVRITRSGESAHDATVSAINEIKQSKLDFTTISVVGQHNVRFPDETYHFLKSLNPNFAKFIPCYNYDAQGEMELFGISPLEYTHFMCRIFDLWLADLPDKQDYRFVLDPITTIIARLQDATVTWCEYRHDKCEHFASLYPNGELWLCDSFDHTAMRETAFIGNA